MRWIILCLFVTLAFGVPKVEFKNSCVPLSQFSNTQKEILFRAYLAGKNDGFGYTLAAIAWQESCAGEYRMNFQDPSAGIFHAYIPGVINRYPKLKQNGFTQNMVGAMLVEDDEFATQIAISELKFWEKQHKGNWRNIIKSYNKGYSWQKNERANFQAEKYYLDITTKVKQLQKHFHFDFVYEAATSKKQNLEYSNKDEKFSEYYANAPKENDFMLLPIYQNGNEFAGPLRQKKTIIQDFELMENY